MLPISVPVLVPVSKPVLLGGGGGGETPRTITAVGIVSTEPPATSVNVSTLGVQAGDLCVLMNWALGNSSVMPTTVIPSGFTAIGVEKTATLGDGSRMKLVMSYKTLTGSESVLTGMASNQTQDLHALVFRKSSGTWGTPKSIASFATFNMYGGSGGPISDQAVSSGSGSPPLVVIGQLADAQGGDRLTFTPSFDAHHKNGNYQGVAFKIITSPVNVTVSSSEPVWGFSLGSFYIELGP